jgi:hydrogenase nickel incorporation protein HypA/HybF
MHEMSIVEALIDLVNEQVRAHPGARVRTVGVRVGRLRQIEPEMLRFCYDAAVNGTPLEHSALAIEKCDASARCDVCRLVFPVEQNWFECPRCHSLKAALLSGDELQLTTVELAAPTVPAAACAG